MSDLRFFFSLQDGAEEEEEGWFRGRIGPGRVTVRMLGVGSCFLMSCALPVEILGSQLSILSLISALMN